MIVGASAAVLAIEVVRPWSRARGIWRFVFLGWLAWLIAHIAVEWAGDDIGREAARSFVG